MDCLQSLVITVAARVHASGLQNGIGPSFFFQLVVEKKQNSDNEAESSEFFQCYQKKKKEPRLIVFLSIGWAFLVFLV